LAQGREGDRFLGFSFGEAALVFMDPALLLIEPEVAAAYQEKIRSEDEKQKMISAEGSSQTNPEPIAGEAVDPYVRDNGAGGGGSSSTRLRSSVKKHFYGSIELDPFQAKKQFADLMDEVIQQFTIKSGVNVKISIEIQAESPVGFDDGVQRAVKENCNVLKFKNAEFEEDFS
jgi:hypothetical protein